MSEIATNGEDAQRRERETQGLPGGAGMSAPKSIRFRVPCEPKGKSRPRFNGKFAYKDKKQARWEDMFTLYASEHRPEQPFEGPLMMKIMFVINRPKRLQRKRDSPELIPCDKKPDLDNLVKSVQDSLNGQGWWNDDSQVAMLTTGKAYSEKGMPARIEVEISQITDPTQREQ